ncbi:MAG: hypothetical protein WBB94_02955 [Candidatus Saccharimonadaceae bacterium]
MPYITVIHTSEYAPSWKPGTFGNELYEFCCRLPVNIVKFDLDEQITTADTQISFIEHGQFDINPAGVHFRVEFTEKLALDRREEFRDLLAKRIARGLGNLITAPPIIILEINWGDWCGALIYNGLVVRTW